MVNWSIAQQPSASERAFESGFQRGEYVRQRGEQEAQRNALAGYAANPNDQTFNALAQAAPEYAIQVRGQRDQQAQEQQVQQLRAAAASGDRAALQQLAAIDPTSYNSLSTQRRQYEQGMVEAASNLAQRVLTLPPEQRAGVYQQQIGILGQRFPELAGQEYSDELMQSTIAEAGQWQDFNRSQQPDYMVIDTTEDLVNTRDPAALAEFAASRGRGQIAPAQQPVARSVGGATYYQNPSTGEWFDNPQEAAGTQMSAPNMQNTSAPALGANGLPSELTVQQYNALVNESSGNRAAVDDYLSRMGIRVRNN